jgi:uncharacterized membrane protein YeaQ/YmgE (transglycosylase-associated protein family)
MAVIFFLIFGLVVGLIARALHPGRDAMGWIATMLLGIGGSFLGWIVGRALGWYHDLNHLRPAGLLMSVLGAVLLLTLWRAATRRRVV